VNLPAPFSAVKAIHPNPPKLSLVLGWGKSPSPRRAKTRIAFKRIQASDVRVLPPPKPAAIEIQSQPFYRCILHLLVINLLLGGLRCSVAWIQSPAMGGMIRNNERAFRALGRESVGFVEAMQLQ
jgi:hypothetical protein